MMLLSISELSTYRSELAEEIECVARHGFDSMSLWRTKLSDVGIGEARGMLGAAGIRVSSLLWGGGFTGWDGRSFRESVEDVREGIAAAAELSTDVLVIHTGCRGGHTISHARRLLSEALWELAPEAEAVGVTIALEPMPGGNGPECGLLDDISETVDWLDSLGETAVGLALDLWHCGHDSRLEAMLPELLRRTAVVQVADRIGAFAGTSDRLPPGHGTLPLQRLVRSLGRHGYRGPLEFECIGEAVEAMGYEALLGGIRAVCGTWLRQPEAAGGFR